MPIEIREIVIKARLEAATSSQARCSDAELLSRWKDQIRAICEKEVISHIHEKKHEQLRAKFER